MLHRLDHVLYAAKLLQVEEIPFRQRFVQAVSQFWAAMFDPADWPTDLLEQAEEIVCQILAFGPISRTVRKMNDTEAREVASKIIRLAGAIEQARGKSGAGSIP